MVYNKNNFNRKEETLMLSATTGTIVAIVVWLIMIGVLALIGFLEGNLKDVKKLIINTVVRGLIVVAYFVFIYEPFLATKVATIDSELLQMIAEAVVPVIVLGPSFFKMVNVFDNGKFKKVSSSNE